MTKEELSNALHNKDLSSEAYDVIESIINEFDSDCEEMQEDKLQDLINEFVGNELMFYDEAWSYLQEQHITDFKDAIENWDATGVCQIAAYYLCEEIDNAI